MFLVTCVNSSLQHKQREDNDEDDKRNREQREKTEAVKGDLHVPKEEATPPLLGLADFGLTIRADIPHLVAVADGKIALHRGHPDLVVKFFFAN